MAFKSGTGESPPKQTTFAREEEEEDNSLSSPLHFHCVPQMRCCLISSSSSSSSSPPPILPKEDCSLLLSVHFCHSSLSFSLKDLSAKSPRMFSLFLIVFLTESTAVSTSRKVVVVLVYGRFSKKKLTTIYCLRDYASSWENAFGLFLFFSYTWNEKKKVFLQRPFYSSLQNHWIETFFPFSARWKKMKWLWSPPLSNPTPTPFFLFFFLSPFPQKLSNSNGPSHSTRLCLVRVGVEMWRLSHLTLYTKMAREGRGTHGHGEGLPISTPVAKIIFFRVETKSLLNKSFFPCFLRASFSMC